MGSSNLDSFGEMLIKSVRDYTIRQQLQSLSGGYKDDQSVDEYNKYALLSDEAKQFVGSLINDVVDSTIHNLLYMLEQNENVDFILTQDQVEVRSKDITDGLCGELYSEDGWIEKYSDFDPSVKVNL